VKKIALWIVATALAGCATQAKFENMLATWVGADENRLISQWGPPDSVYPMTDGSKILTYRRAGQQFIPGYATATTTTYGNQAFTQVNGSPGMMISRNCKIDWTVRQDGRIAQWRLEGNACKSR
jgi:hypothetical protein